MVDIVPRLFFLYPGVAAAGFGVMLGIKGGHNLVLGLIAAVLLLFGILCLAACAFAGERLLWRILDGAGKLGL